MEYPGLTPDDLANVRELNRLWLRLTRRDERLAAAPFLLFSISEHDAELWERLLAGGGQHELFADRLAGGGKLYGLQATALGFLWELSRRNPYVARIIGGAPLTPAWTYKSLSRRGVRSEIRRPPSKDCGGG